MFQIIFQIIKEWITPGVSIFTAIMSIVIINSNKKLAREQGEINKKIYASNKLFDKIFNAFEKISRSLFNNYNDAVKLFPMVDEILCKMNLEDRKAKMIEYYIEAENHYNELVVAIEENRFLLLGEQEELLRNLEDFEKRMLILVKNYECKVYYFKKTSKDYNEFFTTENESDCVKRASGMYEIYKKLCAEMRQYFEEYRGFKGKTDKNQKQLNKAG